MYYCKLVIYFLTDLSSKKTQNRKSTQNMASLNVCR